MSVYDDDSLNDLKDKLGYDLWLLNYLSESEDYYLGGPDLTCYKIKDDFEKTEINERIIETVGSELALNIIDSFRPLIFLSSFKIIDLIIEWILSENYNNGVINRNPWRYKDKIEIFKNEPLVYPKLFQNNNYIKDNILAIYFNGLKYRNEIVHKHNIEIKNDDLIIKTTDNNISYILVLDKNKLGALVRIVIIVAKLLTNNINGNRYIHSNIKYNLDKIAYIHLLKLYHQTEPVIVNVLFIVHQQDGKYIVDIDKIRQHIKRNEITRDIYFNLKILGYKNDQPIISWLFPSEFIQNLKLLELEVGDYTEYKSDKLKENCDEFI